MTVTNVFDVSMVMGLAGPRAYGRGTAYRSDGRVEPHEGDGDRVQATVRGSMPYAVELWMDDGEPQWSCTCPAAEDGSFCKHCVAVALSMTDEEPATTFRALVQDGSSTAEPPVDQDLTGYITRLDRDRLAELVMAQVGTDWRLKERLSAEAQAAAGKGPSIASWQRRIDRVFAPLRRLRRLPGSRRLGRRGRRDHRCPGGTVRRRSSRCGGGAGRACPPPCRCVDRLRG